VYGVHFQLFVELGMDTTNSIRITDNPLLAFVIDDEAKVRDFIAATLAELGLGVACFEMAKDAMASFDLRRPAVIFLDIALLRSDAIDVIRSLGQRRYGGLVQLMSGGRPSLLEAIQRIGLRHRIRLAPPLNKPLAREAIVRVVAGLRGPGDLSGDAAAATPPMGQ